MQRPKSLDHVLSKIQTRYTAVKALIHNHSSEASTSETADKIGYFSLPRELRDKIMDNVLVHGNIYIQPSLEDPTPFSMTFPGEVESTEAFRDRVRSLHTTFLGSIIELAIVKVIQLYGHVYVHTPSIFHAPKPKKTKSEEQGSLPGFQLLATNRRALSECAPIFWSSNTFYLPPGPVCHTRYYFNNVRPQHLALIRRLAIRFSLRDLTERVIMGTEYYTRHQPDSPGRPLQTIPPRGWGKFCAQVLDKIWAEKLFWSRRVRYLPSLETIHFGLDATKSVEFHCGEDLLSALHGIGWDEQGEFHYYRPACRVTRSSFCLCEDMATARCRCRQKVERIVEEIGWTAFKRWLAGKAEYPLKPWNDRDNWRY